MPFLPRTQDSFPVSIMVGYNSGAFSNSHHCQILLQASPWTGLELPIWGIKVIFWSAKGARWDSLSVH